MNENVANLPHNLKPNPVTQTVALTVSSTAIKLTAAVGTPAALKLDAATRYVLVSVEAADVRTCPEGTEPTTDVGQLIPAGSAVLLSIAEASQGQWIATGSDATLQVSQYII